MTLLGGSLGGGGGIFALAGIALVVSIILVLVAGRQDDDRAGTRTQGRYLGTITLPSLFIALFAFFGVVRALTDLIVDKPDEQIELSFVPEGGPGSGIPKELQDIFEQLPIPGLGDEMTRGAGRAAGRGGGARTDDGDYRAAMRSGLLGLAAAGIFVFHLRRARKTGSVFIFLRAWYWMPEHRE